MFMLGQLSFLVAHEFAHHDRGHFSRRSNSDELPNDMKADNQAGSLARQAYEIDADGWATLLTASHWVAEGGRSTVLKAFRCDCSDESAPNELLFAFFVVSISATLLLWPPARVRQFDVYKISHPPQAARMNRILGTFDMWARESCPALASNSAHKLLPTLITAVEDALSAITGGHNWQEQVQFLRTPAGERYWAQLIEHSESQRRA